MLKISSKRFIVALVAGALLAANAVAHSYPGKSVTIVVGFAPGGPTDLLPRVMAKAMSKTLAPT